MTEFIHVSKNYGPVTGLQDLSFRIGERGIVGLLGQNGAGKTTALNILTGYLPPTAGRVLIDGQDLLKEPAACKRKIGYLPEKPPLYDEMTVAEYLRFAASLREVTRQDIRCHVEEIMQLCSLLDVKGRLIGQLSKGYRQRVGLAQALCGDPSVLVLDEPTVGLDPKQVVEIRQLIRELGKDRLVLFSSHLLPEVQQLCDRVLILNHGRLVRFLDMKDDDRGRALQLLLTALGPEEKLLPAFRSLPGIRRVRSLNSLDHEVTEAELTFLPEAEGEDPRVRLFRLLNALDAPLLRLTQKQDSLEELFLQVTSSEETGGGHEC